MHTLPRTFMTIVFFFHKSQYESKMTILNATERQWQISEHCYFCVSLSSRGIRLFNSFILPLLSDGEPSLQCETSSCHPISRVFSYVFASISVFNLSSSTTVLGHPFLHFGRNHLRSGVWRATKKWWARCVLFERIISSSAAA